MLAAMSDVSAERAVTIDLDHLNEAQRAAVTHLHGPLLVIAGPGSGKTRVITHRIAWLIEQGTPPWRILAVTFTNRAAREMRTRLESLIGPEQSTDVWLGTFHRICVRMLRSQGQEIGVPRNFVIFDSDDQMQVVRNALKDLRIDPKQYAPRALLGRISRAKSEGTRREEFVAATGSYFDEIAARVWERYADQLAESAALDFDDLLLRTLDLFEVESVRRAYEERFDHVLVDEFQDTSTIQYQLARAWSAGSGNLTVVGDPDQSIYSWRSADIRNLNYFVRDHREATEVQLNNNYRSTQQILDAANAVIDRASNRIKRRLVTDNRDGPLPRLHEAYSESDEAEYISSHVELGLRDGSLRPSDAAVLYRTNAQSRAIEESLVQHGIPYRLVGATRFYDRREVRDLLAYLRLLRNAADPVAFTRVVNVPTRGIGAKTLDVLTEWSADHARSASQAAAAAAGIDADALGGYLAPPPVSRRAAASLKEFVELIDEAREQASREPLSDVLRSILVKTRYREWLVRQSDTETEAESRWENVQELITVTENYSEIAPGAALDAFLEDVALVADVDDLPDGPPDAVTLITLHQAKGLEFPVVFMVGLEEYLLPHQLSMDDPNQLQEERRLCYVGMTRAMRELHLLHAFRRAYQGRSGHNPPSRFLADIPEELLQRHQRQQARVGDDVRPARNRTVRWDDFDSFDAEPVAAPSVGLKEGDEVSHEIFGHGVVIALRTIGRDAEVTVRFADTGVKRLLASMANLTRA
ncbi:MAG: AAA family ATPase [Chloroflexi bacterium]|nr:AAA family ATPase [Chloroflexota bacterium]MYI04811.1 AAA family ATPase [Chloroflexota bacterium]